MVQVVIVVVADHHYVHLGQVCNGAGSRANPLGAHKGNRGAPAAEDGVCEDGDSIHLHQN